MHFCEDIKKQALKRVLQKFVYEKLKLWQETRV